MIQFYAPDILDDPQLPPTESSHCIRVLRHTIGDPVQIIDGKGHEIEAVITSPSPKGVAVDIIAVKEAKPYWANSITVAVAPTKNMDRLEWFVEKAVEIGVTRIVPVLCARSERKTLKRERLEKVAVSAMKQSLKATLPAIDELTPLVHFLNEPSEDCKMMGYCDKEYPRHDLVEVYQPGCDVRILVGPEGDFSPEEVKLAVDCGYIPVTFGDCRLRTETAALFGLEAIHIINKIHSLPPKH